MHNLSLVSEIGMTRASGVFRGRTSKGKENCLLWECVGTEQTCEPQVVLMKRQKVMVVGTE